MVTHNPELETLLTGILTPYANSEIWKNAGEVLLLTVLMGDVVIVIRKQKN